jgi:hypothetical protein
MTHFQGGRLSGPRNEVRPWHRFFTELPPHCGRFYGRDQFCVDCGHGLKDRVHSDSAQTLPEQINTICR